MSVQGTNIVQDQVSKLQAMAKGLCTPVGCAAVTKETLSQISKNVRSLFHVIFNGSLSDCDRNEFYLKYKSVTQHLTKMNAELVNGTLTTLHCTALFLSIFRIPYYNQVLIFDTFFRENFENAFAQAVAKHDFNLAQKLILDNPALLNIRYREGNGIGSLHPGCTGSDTSLLNVFCNRRNVEAVDFLLQLGEKIGYSTLPWIFHSFVTEEEFKSSEAILRRILESGFNVNQLRDDDTGIGSKSTPIGSLIVRVAMSAFERLLPTLVDLGNAQLDRPCSLTISGEPRTALEFSQKFTFEYRSDEQEICTRALIFNGASVPEGLAPLPTISRYLSIREQVVRKYFDDLRDTLSSLKDMHQLPLVLRNCVVSYITLPLPQMRELCYKQMNICAQLFVNSQASCFNRKRKQFA